MGGQTCRWPPCDHHLVTRWRRPYRDPYWLLAYFPAVGVAYFVYFLVTSVADWSEESGPLTIAELVGFAAAVALA
jgi:hypothetical protein